MTTVPAPAVGRAPAAGRAADHPPREPHGRARDSWRNQQPLPPDDWPGAVELV